MLAPIRRFAERMHKTVISVFWQTPRPLQKHATADYLTSYKFQESPLEAFSSLSDPEKLYLHNMAKAIGCLKMILIHQNSFESPMLFSVFYELFSKYDIPALIEKAKASEFRDTDLKALIDYAVLFFVNGGNSQSGQVIAPGFDKLKFRQLINELPVVVKLGDSCMNDILDAMYSSAVGAIRPSTLCSELSEEDCAQVKDFLAQHGLSQNDCRVFKTPGPPPRFELLFPSGEEDIPVASLGDEEEPEASPAKDDGRVAKKARLHEPSAPEFVVKFGDYRLLLAKACSFLAAAKSYADESQTKMIVLLTEELMQASWVARDERLLLFVDEPVKAVEVFVDFNCQTPQIRSCLDQRHLGALVGVQNITHQARLNAIMAKQKELTDVLKWDPDYLESDTEGGVSQFVVLDVAQGAFYDEIPLGMHISEKPASANVKNFINNILSKSLVELQALILKNKKAYLDNAEHLLLMDVALHEFIGHAAGGRLFTQDEERSIKSMVTGENVPADELYGTGENYASRFAEIDAQFEELRAEAIMLLLAAEGQVASVFGDQSRLLSVLMVHHSVSKGLLRYLCCPEAENGVLSWPDDHSRAFFALCGFLEATIPGLIALDMASGEFDIDESVIPAMLTALVDFIRMLQTLKATGDDGSARQLLTTLAKPSQKVQEWRRTVEATVEWPPLTAKMCASTRIADDGSGSTAIKEDYAATAQDFFNSIVENYRGIYDVQILYDQWLLDAKRFSGPS